MKVADANSQTNYMSMIRIPPYSSGPRRTMASYPIHTPNYSPTLATARAYRFFLSFIRTGRMAWDWHAIRKAMSAVGQMSC